MPQIIKTLKNKIKDVKVHLIMIVLMEFLSISR